MIVLCRFRKGGVLIRKPWLWLCLMLVVGCSHDSLDRDSAAKQINAHLGANEKKLMFNVGRVGRHCSTVDLGDGKQDEVDLDPAKDISTVVALKAGYVTTAIDGKDYWKVTLTDKGQAFLKKHPGLPYPNETKNGCDFHQVEFPLATASVVEVTSITTGADVREADYSWNWSPTELGVALQEGGEVYSKLDPNQRESLEFFLNFGDRGPKLKIPVPGDNEIHRSTSRFKKYDDGWRLQ
jgi:hypothetical protein